jgi:2-aminoadipate transaminase
MALKNPQKTDGSPKECTSRYDFARRMARTPRSFIREILKVTERPEIISFAGGLPNPALIDVEGIRRAAARVLEDDGRVALQYSTSEGYLPLREFIAKRYQKRLGLSVSPDEILITNGSQQCLDLIGKVFINAGDHVTIERPGYLGAIQAFSLYEPVFHPIDLRPDGPDISTLESVISGFSVPLFYGVPNSQNPSGITYSEQQRQEVTSVLDGKKTVFVEDDAYGDLQFSNGARSSFRKFLPSQTVITGSFSKILSPGMRMGWVCAPPEVIEQLVVAKQASDLHSNYLSQRIAAQYLADEDIDAHIRKICFVYKKQRDLMLTLMEETFPPQVTWTEPQGGMFIWVTLPDGCSSMKVFEAALKESVAVLPGTPFYIDGGGNQNLRLNFSNAREDQIITGVERLGRVIRTLVP